MSLPIFQLIPFIFSSFSCWYQISSYCSSQKPEHQPSPSLTHLILLRAKFWMIHQFKHLSNLSPYIYPHLNNHGQFLLQLSSMFLQEPGCLQLLPEQILISDRVTFLKYYPTHFILLFKTHYFFIHFLNSCFI